MSDASPPPLAETGQLALVSTPIGNLADCSARAIETLRQADLILCEDTRTSATLLRHFAIATRTEALHEHNESAKVPALLDRIRQGARLALISDAGTPLLADPGYRLTAAAIASGLLVTAIPGPNAATMALTLSGLPPTPHLFAGFPPPKTAARRRFFDTLRGAERAGLAATLIFYEAPHRLADCLADAVSVLGDRQAALARELTKRFEEVRRDSLANLAAHYASTPPRGECVLVLAPAAAMPGPSDAEIDSLLRVALEEGKTVRDAVDAVQADTALPRRALYARALALTKG